MNFYDILGVPRDANAETIKKVYKKKSAILHPDKGGDEAAFKLLNEAYQILGDAEKRAEYDALLGTGHELYDANSVVIAGYLPSAGVPYSAKFRQQHRDYIAAARSAPMANKIQNERLSRVYPSSLQLEWLTQFYNTLADKETQGETGNSVDVLMPLTPTIVDIIHIATKFFAGKYSSSALKQIITYVIYYVGAAQFNSEQQGFLSAFKTLLSGNAVTAETTAAVSAVSAFLRKLPQPLQAQFATPLLDSPTRQMPSYFYTHLHTYANNKKTGPETLHRMLAKDMPLDASLAITLLHEFLHLSYCGDDWRVLKTTFATRPATPALPAAEAGVVAAVAVLISIEVLNLIAARDILIALSDLLRYSNQINVASATQLSLLLQSQAAIRYIRHVLDCYITLGGDDLPDSRPRLTQLTDVLIANFTHQTEHEKKVTIALKRFYDMQAWFEHDLFQPVAQTIPASTPASVHMTHMTQGNHARALREKIFHMLDWYPAVFGLGTNKQTVHRGITFSLTMLANYQLYLVQQLQHIARSEPDSAIAIADERLALRLLLEVLDISRRLTPALELYLIIQMLPRFDAFHYQLPNVMNDASSLEKTVEHLMQRAKFLLPTHPLASHYRASVELDDYGTMAKQFVQRHLELLIQIDQQILDPDVVGALEAPRVNLYYQAHHGLLRGWLVATDILHGPTIRQQLIDVLLAAKRWLASEVEANNSAPTMRIPRDALGFLKAEASWQEPKHTKETYYQSINGFAIDKRTGEVTFYFLPPKPDLIAASALFTLDDLGEVFRLKLPGALLSLDEVDEHMPLHPFNHIRFEPPQLFHSQAFASMLLTDQMLKYITTDKEPSATYPFAQRDGNAFIQHIDQIQKWVKDEFQELQAKQNLTDETQVHRFWIESKDIGVMRQEDDTRTTVMLDPFEMQVKTRSMRLNAQGMLVDDEHGDEGRKIFFADPQRQTPITGPAIIIDKKTSKIYFLNEDEEQHYPLTEDNNRLHVTVDMSNPDDKRIYLDPLYATTNHAKLTPEGALIIDEQNVKYAFLFSYEVCVRSKLPNHYSAEYIFARRMSLHYHGLGYVLPQFGRLQQFQAMMVVYRLLRNEYKHNRSYLDRLENIIPQINAYLRQRLYQCKNSGYYPHYYPTVFAGVLISAEIAELNKTNFEDMLDRINANISKAINAFHDAVKENNNNLKANLARVDGMRGYTIGDTQYLYPESQREQDKQKAHDIFRQDTLSLVESYRLSRLDHDKVINTLTGSEFFRNVNHAADIISRHLFLETIETAVNTTVNGNIQQLEGPRWINASLERLGFGQQWHMHTEHNRCTWTPAAVNVQSGKQRVVYGGVNLFATTKPSTLSSYEQHGLMAGMTSRHIAVRSDQLFNSGSYYSTSNSYTTTSYAQNPPPASASQSSSGGGGSGGGRGGSGGDGGDGSGDEGSGSRQRGTPKGYQDHHIISKYNKLVKDHPVLELAGFDIESRANKIFLPKYDSDDMHPTRSLHRGGHTKEYSQDIKRRMDRIVESGQAQNWGQAQYHDELLAMLRQVRSELKQGTIALNSVARPQAKK